MKLFCTLLCCCWIIANASAQNLVPNPSFEEYLECPFSTGELDNQLVDWFSWQMSPDFFHPCSDVIDGFAGVPDNVWGSQFPISGDAYTAIITYEDFNPEGREFIAAELTETLIIGHEYYLLFHVSLCDGGLNEAQKCATNNLGLRFFKDPNYGVNGQGDGEFEVDNFAHLNRTDIITNDQNWIRIEGSFISDDNYNWVAIGNFFDDANTLTEILNDEMQCWGYYYVENVCVAQNAADCDYLLGFREPSGQIEELVVYPNPTRDLITVRLERELITAITVNDLRGGVLFESAIIPTNSTQLDLSSLPKGMYLLRVQTKKTFFNRKILIK
jgi:hypothetical protein